MLHDIWSRLTMIYGHGEMECCRSRAFTPSAGCWTWGQASSLLLLCIPSPFFFNFLLTYYYWTRSYYTTQIGVELTTGRPWTCDPPASNLLNSRITGLHHYIWLDSVIQKPIILTVMPGQPFSWLIGNLLRMHPLTWHTSKSRQPYTKNPAGFGDIWSYRRRRLLCYIPPRDAPPANGIDLWLPFVLWVQKFM